MEHTEQEPSELEQEYPAYIYAGYSCSSSDGSCSVCSIDLSMDWAVGITKAEDSVSCIWQYRRERVCSTSARTVEHLGLQFAKLVLEVGEIIGKGLNDGRVPCARDCFFRGSQILGTRSIEKIVQCNVPWLDTKGP